MQIEEMGAQEVAEGLTRMAASEALAERSEELTAAGIVLGVKGVEAVETAAAAAELAREIGEVGVAGIAEGAAVLGRQQAQTLPSD